MIILTCQGGGLGTGGAEGQPPDQYFGLIMKLFTLMEPSLGYFTSFQIANH